MTFSEALEKYLQAREAARHFGEGRNRNDALQEMKEAAEHMDALTSLPPNGEVRGASRPAGLGRDGCSENEDDARAFAMPALR